METQPIEGNASFGRFSLAHNGNIPHVNGLKNKYGIEYETESDTIIMVKIIEKLSYKYNNWLDVLIDIINGIQGVYCLIILTEKGVYEIRDAYGVKPLSIW